jgi:hypothetical protein
MINRWVSLKPQELVTSPFIQLAMQYIIYMRLCKVCSWPARSRSSVDKALASGMTATDVARKYSRPNRPITRQAVARHSRHVLSPAVRPRTSAPGPAIQGQSLVDRVEGLIAEHLAIVETAKSSGQLIAAIAALREIRANFELQGKLSGEISSQNINFYMMDITESRIEEFVDAVAKRGPQVGQLLRDRALKTFGHAAPNIQINFVPAPKRDGHGNLVLEAKGAASPPLHEAN